MGDKIKRLNQLTGQRGEAAAGKYLRRKGYQIVTRNFRTRFGEIDLIAKQKNTLVFVEVKTSKGRGRPEWQISPRKLSQVKKMAQVYLTTHKVRYTDLRIDVVCVVLNSQDELLKINHYEAIGAQLINS